MLPDFIWFSGRYVSQHLVLWRKPWMRLGAVGLNTLINNIDLHQEALKQ